MDTGTTHAGTSVAVGDYDRDGWPDIYAAEWRLDRYEPLEGGPNNNRLLRNLGPDAPGHFEDVTQSAGVLVSSERSETHDGAFVFAPAFVDLDGDGWQDLAFAADFGSSGLFWNQGDGTFVDGTAEAGVGIDEFGMGSAFGDLDRDGSLDWFVTSIGPYPGYQDPDRVQLGNMLYMNRGSRRFDEIGESLGVWDGSWGWGAAFLDHDNDADLDLVMTNGIDEQGVVYPNQYKADPTRFWRNDGTEPWPEVARAIGTGDTLNGKGLLTWDPDEDGDLDLFVVNNGDHPIFYRNLLNDGSNWLRVRAVEPNGAPSLGARVVVERLDGTTEVQEVGVGTHFLGQSEPVAHFGLGADDDTAVAVEVTWPRLGISTRFDSIEPNQVLVVEPPAEPGLP